MAEASRQLKEQHYSNWGGVILCVVYNAAALACLFQWGSPAMWSRVNLFTGGFLVINALWILELNRFSQKTLISTEVRREFTGVEYDPLVKERTKLLATLLPVAMNASEILIFLDYGHWHLLPALENPVLQGLGLVMAGVAFAWLLWVDVYLGQYFLTARFNQKFLSEGPYHYVRHPRYAAIVVGHVVRALIFASLIGWVLVIVRSFPVWRRMRVEEAHMQGMFGNDYRQYQQQTARLIPGIY